MTNLILNKNESMMALKLDKFDLYKENRNLHTPNHISCAKIP